MLEKSPYVLSKPLASICRNMCTVTVDSVTVLQVLCMKEKSRIAEIYGTPVSFSI